MPNPPEDESELSYDPEAARRGWEATADLRAKVAPGMTPILPLDRVAILGLRVGEKLLEPEVRSEFELLHPKHFDPAILDRMEPVSWALWFANDSLFLEEAGSSGAKVSLATLEHGSGIRKQMLDVCTFALGDHDVASRILAQIRSGQGHADLALDLSRLARLYVKYQPIVSKVGLKYDADDASAAVAASQRIVRELSQTDNKALQKAKEETSRAFAVFDSDYNTLRRWATAIWDDEDFIPSMHSVRGSGRPKKKKADAGEDGGTT